MPHLAEFADPGHDVGFAAEKDAGLMLIECVEARIGPRLRIVAWRPSEGVGRDAQVDQPRLDGVERSAVEVNEILLAIVLAALVVGSGMLIRPACTTGCCWSPML